MAKRDFLSVADFAPGEVEQLVKKTVRMKKEAWPQVLQGKTVVLLFEKPSLRTRLSFELAVHQMGKRFKCEVCNTEVLCTKSGEGSIMCCDKEMELQKPKALPSSD